MMRTIMEKFQLEPVAVINGTVALIEAIIALAISFGLGLTAQQVVLIMTVVITAGNLAQTLLVRSRVTPIVNPHKDEGEHERP